MMAVSTSYLASAFTSSKACQQTSLRSDNSESSASVLYTLHGRHTLYRNKYQYILSGINAASRYKIARPLRTKQAKDVAEMIADIHKVGPLTYPKTFQCGSGCEFKREVTKLLEKHEVKIWRVTMKYKHTHTAFVKSLTKVLSEQLFKVQDTQELNDPEKYRRLGLSTYVD